MKNMGGNMAENNNLCEMLGRLDPDEDVLTVEFDEITGNIVKWKVGNKKKKIS